MLDPHEVEDTDCYMRLTLPDGSEAFMRRDRYKQFYRAVHKVFAQAGVRTASSAK